MKLSVVIPVFNEEKTIYQLLEMVLAEKTPKEIIVVDDGSTDGTFKIIKKVKSQISKSNLEFKIIRNPINMGKGVAVRKGIENATGDILIIQDADLEYNPEDYARLIQPIIEKKAKVVYGTRLKTLPFKLFGKNKTPMPLHYLANRFLSLITNWLYDSNLTDMETGYKMIPREIYKKLRLEANRFEIEPEITAKILKLGFKILEVPITTKPRGYREGKKIKARDAFIAAWTLFKFRFLK